MSNRTKRRGLCLYPRDARAVVHMLAETLKVFSLREARSGSICICQFNIWKDRETLTKERRCTPAEIKAVGAPSLPPHPPTLALGR